ncbi:hypothetical protein CEP53_014344 [Fusarium sp. AF-6]|nr:hypothetical protein CEP53_014344 [Fusarium sp. AF-6]
MRRDCTPQLHSHDFLTPGTPAAKLDKEPCLVSVVRTSASTASEEHYCKHELGHEALNYGGQVGNRGNRPHKGLDSEQTWVAG